MNSALSKFPQLDQVVLWMLSKQPHERPKTAGELALMLRRMLEKKLIDDNPPKAKKSGPRPSLAFEENPPARASGSRPSLLMISGGPPPPPDAGAAPAPPPSPVVPLSGPGTDMLQRRRVEYGEVCKSAQKAESERNWDEALNAWEKAAELAEDPVDARTRAENCRREISMQSQLSVVDEAVLSGNWEKAEHVLVRLSAVRAKDPRIEQIRARLPKRLIQSWLNLAKTRIEKLPEGDLRHALTERLGIAHAQAGNMQEAVTVLHAASPKTETRVVGMAQAIVESVHHGHLEGLRPWLDTASAAAAGLADPAERGRASLEVGLAFSAYGDHGAAGQAFHNALNSYSEANTKGIPMHALSRRTSTGVLRRPSMEMMRSIATSSVVTTTSIGGPKSVKASWEAAVGVVAQAQADAGLVDDSLASAALIEDPWTLAHSLSQVAQALAKTGRSVEAERVAGQISFSLPKMQALRALAVARVYRGDLAGAEEQYKSISTPADRIYLQGLLATAWALRGDKGRAEFRVLEVSKSIGDVVGARARFYALLSAIEPLLNAGFHDLAAKLISEASHLADLIDDPAERLRGLLQMASIQENARSTRFSATRTMVFGNQPDSGLAEVLRRSLMMWRQVRSGPDRFECGERLAYNVANASMPVLCSELLSACKDEAEAAIVYIGLSSGVS
jgi:hypothetical protein